MSLTNSYNMLLSLQCNFKKYMCDQIFGNDSNHLYPKWVSSDGNILHFLTRLDDENREKLLRYAFDQFGDGDVVNISM